MQDDIVLCCCERVLALNLICCPWLAFLHSAMCIPNVTLPEWWCFGVCVHMHVYLLYTLCRCAYMLAIICLALICIDSHTCYVVVSLFLFRFFRIRPHCFYCLAVVTCLYVCAGACWPAKQAVWLLLLLLSSQIMFHVWITSSLSAPLKPLLLCNCTILSAVFDVDLFHTCIWM